MNTYSLAQACANSKRFVEYFTIFVKYLNIFFKT